EVYVDNNVNGTTTLFEVAKNFKNLRFVMASSSSVYGGCNEAPFKESADVDKPISVYAATKRACEIMAQTYHHLYGMDVWCLRFFTCYGPSQRPDLAIHKFTKLIDRDQPVPMFGDGSTCRDYLYIDDCVRGVMSAIDHCKGYEVVNLGESRTVRLDELIALIGKTLGKEPTIDYQPEQPGDVPQTWADLTKAKALLDYDPGTMIEEGLEHFVAWYRGQ
ncbi:MAG: GDP-mannose 4,6-dehydratase, partial [Planctomycetes bacterium]|nr:GDP-mannose 4,6-dehydratase [Planctomycetota bacterium]